MLLSDLPDGILEDIAFECVAATFLGPPSSLTTFLLISKRIYLTLNFRNRPTLYARVFKEKFDYKPPRRRGLLRNAQEEAVELTGRFISLKRLKRGCEAYPRYVYNDREDGGLRIDMWVAHRMFLENDGKNGRQLVLYAGLNKFAFDWVRRSGRLHDGRRRNNGWMIENELNALAMWLFWFTDYDRVVIESPEQRAGILTALSGVYACQFKYMHQRHLSLTHRSITLTTPPPFTTAIPHLITPNVYYHSPPCRIPLPTRFITLSRPLLTPPVLLSFICREEYAASLTPLRITEGYPMTRAEAQARGFPPTSPVGEDYLEARATIKLERIDWRGEVDKEASRSFDSEWARLSGCWALWNRYFPRGVSGMGITPGTYKPGMLSQWLWTGQWKHLPMPQYEQIRELAFRNEPISMEFSTTDYGSTYMKIRIQEHFCCSSNPQFQLPFLETAEAQLNAWMPEGTRFHERGGSLIVRCGEPALTTYEYSTYNPRAYEMMDADGDEEDNSPFGHNIHDILITAKTEETFSQKFNQKESFIGRIRPWDHLVVLIRDLPEKTVGRWLFTGYLHSDGVLIGRWRETGSPSTMVGWGGTYYLQAKSEESL